MTGKTASDKPKKLSKFWIILSSFLFLYIIFISFGSHGLFTFFELKKEKENIEADLKADSIKLKDLQKYKDNLENDDKTIEKIAREKYNMQKDGETIYIIEKKDSLKSKD
jgi:cell division protein FtsB